MNSFIFSVPFYLQFVAISSAIQQAISWIQAENGEQNNYTLRPLYLPYTAEQAALFLIINFIL